MLFLCQHSYSDILDTLFYSTNKFTFYCNTQPNKHAHAHTHARARARAHTHTHTHTHTHAHTQFLAPALMNIYSLKVSYKFLKQRSKQLPVSESQLKICFSGPERTGTMYSRMDQLKFVEGNL